MIPNHHQLLGLLARAEPAFMAAHFATEFPAYPDREGECGTVLYFEGGYWDIRMDGGPTYLLAPGGSRIIGPDGVEDGPAMGRLPSRPPWSLVLPRWSTFLGREDDDWQMDADIPVTEDGASWAASLTSLESPAFHGTLGIDPETCAITRVELGHMVQTLLVVRTEPTAADLAALETIKSTVQQFTAQT